MRAACALLLALALPGAHAATLKVLSAGVGEGGLKLAAPAYEKAGGAHVTVEFAVPQKLKERVLSGEQADLLIAPQPVIEALLAAGKAQGPAWPLGQVGVGVVVRKGDARPAIATPDDIKQAAASATAVIYNRASTGQYVEQLLQRLGLAEAIAAKVQRYADGDAVMRQVIAAPRGTLGFGAIAEIKLYTDQGADYVGPLPAALQNYTRYQAVVLSGADPQAPRFLDYLATPQAKAWFAASGMEPPP